MFKNITLGYITNFYSNLFLYLTGYWYTMSFWVNLFKTFSLLLTALEIFHKLLYPQPCYASRIIQQVFSRLIRISGKLLKFLLLIRLPMLHVCRVLQFCFYHCQISSFLSLSILDAHGTKFLQEFLKLAFFPLHCLLSFLNFNVEG